MSTSTLVCEIAETEDLTEASLPAEELAIAQNISSDKRREQFLLGRTAAHIALDIFPGPAASSHAIIRGADGEPIWPSGVVGSISHTDGVGVAAVGSINEFDGLGIDIERITRSISDGAIEKVALPAELAWVNEDPAHRHIRALQVFCAKESIYKAYHPLCKKPMGFNAAFVTWDSETQAFIGTLLKDLSEIHQAGDIVPIHCTVSEGYIVCCTILPREMDD